MAISSKEKQDRHNQGQTDAANGVYNPPVGLQHALTLGFSITTADVERQEAYDAGVENARNRRP